MTTLPPCNWRVLKKPPDWRLCNACMILYQPSLNQPWPSYFPTACFPKQCNSSTRSWLGLSIPSVWWVSSPRYIVPDLTWGILLCFIHESQRRARVAVTTEMEIIWIQFLPPGTSAQRVKLQALTQTLIMGKGLAVNIYRQQVCICNCSCVWSHLPEMKAPNSREKNCLK